MRTCSAALIMSPCCLSPRGGGGRGAPGGANSANDEALAAVKTPADSAKLPFGLRAQLASAAAWSPNPNNSPLYLDLPLGDNQQAVMAKWAAERTAGVHRSVHPRPAPLPRHRHRRRRSGRIAGRCRQAARRARSVRHRAHLRGLPGDAHERRRRPLPGARHAVLQPDAVVQAGARCPIRSRRRGAGRTASRTAIDRGDHPCRLRTSNRNMEAPARPY